MIDDRLRDVVEIPKLRFPHHERIGSDHRITVFESEHARFRERTVENLETAAAIFFRAQFGKRRPCLPGLRVIQNGMSLAEGAASRILSTQAHARAFERERTEGNRFGKRPIHGLITLAHLCAARQLADHFWIQVETFRYQRNPSRDGLDHVRFDCGIHDI